MKFASCCSGMLVLQVSCFHSRVAEDFLLGCNPASLGDQFTVTGDCAGLIFKGFIEFCLWRWAHLIVSKHQVPSTQWCDVTSQKNTTLICSSCYSSMCFMVQWDLPCVAATFALCLLCSSHSSIISCYIDICIMLQWCLHLDTVLCAACWSDVLLCKSDTCIMLQWYLHHVTVMSASWYSCRFN